VRWLRWLIAINPITLTSSITSVVIGSSVLANLGRSVDILRAIITAVGVSMLQASANLVDDYFDYLHGLDKPGSQRRKHPILDLGIEPSKVVEMAAVLSIAGGLIGVALALTSANAVAVFLLMLIGAFIVWQYSAPPLRLRHRGFGEIVSPIVMGPLIAMGTFLVLNGNPGEAWLAAIAAVPNMAMTLLALAAVDIDHIEMDRVNGKRTIATVFGVGAVKAVAALSVVLYMVGVIVSVALGALPIYTLVSILFIIIPIIQLRLLTFKPSVVWRGAFMGRLLYALSALVATTLKTVS